MEAVIKMDEFWKCTADIVGHGAPVVEHLLTLEDLYKMLVGSKCKWDDTPLTKDEEVELHAYEHDSGWTVKGYNHRLWLSLMCPYCKYEWSIWKLGVDRFGPSPVK